MTGYIERAGQEAVLWKLVLVEGGHWNGRDHGSGSEDGIIFHQ